MANPAWQFGSVRLNRLTSAATSSLALAIGLLALNLAISALTARVLGAHGFGIFATSIALLTILSIPAVLGIDRIVTRSIATHHERDEAAAARGLLGTTTQFVLISSLAIAAVSIGIVANRADWFADPLAVAVAAAALPLVSLSRLRQAALLGLGHVIAAQVPEAIVRPLAYLAALAGLMLTGSEVTPALALALYTASAFVGFLLGTALLRRVTARVLGQGDTVPPARGWWREALPLTLVSGSGLLIANLPVLVVSAFTGPAEAGIFAVAHRAASIQTLGLTAVNTVVGPTIARLKARSDTVSLQRVLTRSSRLAFGIALLVGGAMILGHEQVLGLFGEGFRVAALPLVILTAGQLSSAACGSVGTLFVMTNQARIAAAGLLFGASATASLLFLLVPPLGVIGASIATATGVATLNIYQVIIAWFRFRTDPTIFGRQWRIDG